MCYIAQNLTSRLRFFSARLIKMRQNYVNIIKTKELALLTISLKLARFYFGRILCIGVVLRIGKAGVEPNTMFIKPQNFN